MKTVIFLTIFTTILLSGCASSANNDNAAQTLAVTTVGSTTENFCIPSRETFAELPDEQVNSLDLVMNAADEAFPKESRDIKRYYGYIGEESVEKSLCFVFAVYTQTNEGQSQIATIAITEDNTKAYILDETTQEYKLLKTFSDKKTLDEFSWSFREVTGSEDIFAE